MGRDGLENLAALPRFSVACRFSLAILLALGYSLRTMTITYFGSTYTVSTETELMALLVRLSMPSAA
jgi:hypothetical protein